MVNGKRILLNLNLQKELKTQLILIYISNSKNKWRAVKILLKWNFDYPT